MTELFALGWDFGKSCLYLGSPEGHVYQYMRSFMLLIWIVKLCALA